jgi:hypothetical protein
MSSLTIFYHHRVHNSKRRVPSFSPSRHPVLPLFPERPALIKKTRSRVCLVRPFRPLAAASHLRPKPQPMPGSGMVGHICLKTSKNWIRVANRKQGIQGNATLMIITQPRRAAWKRIEITTAAHKWTAQEIKRKIRSNSNSAQMSVRPSLHVHHINFWSSLETETNLQLAA